MQAINVNLKGLLYEAKIRFDQIKEDLKKLEKDPEIYVFAIFEEIRRQIDFHRDQIIEKTQKQSQEMIDRLNKLEKEIKANVKSVERDGYYQYKCH